MIVVDSSEVVRVSFVSGGTKLLNLDVREDKTSSLLEGDGGGGKGEQEIIPSFS